MRKAVLCALGVAAALGLYFGVRHVRHRNESTASVAYLPELTLSDLNGNAIQTSDLRGKVVLVNFWAAWCAPCAEEIPQFMTLQQKYGDRGVQVIGISIDDIDSELRSFYRKHSMNYPVVAGDQKITDAFGGVPGLPTTFIIDRHSRVAARQVGATDFQSLEREVVKLLH